LTGNVTGPLNKTTQTRTLGDAHPNAARGVPRNVWSKSAASLTLTARARGRAAVNACIADMNVRSTSSGYADDAAPDISRARPGDVIKSDETSANNATAASSNRREGSHWREPIKLAV
jgi:hypothetical protein